MGQGNTAYGMDNGGSSGLVAFEIPEINASATPSNVDDILDKEICHDPGPNA